MSNETNAKVANAKALLSAKVRGLQTSDDWKAILSVIAKRSRLSPKRFSFQNQLLAFLQAPDAEVMATYKTWLSLGRQVQRDQKSYITVFGPIIAKDKGTGERRMVGVKPVSQFTIAQTAGKELPAEPKIVTDLEDDGTFLHSVESIRDIALGLGPDIVSSFTLRARMAGDPKGAHGWYIPATKAIVVITGESSRVQVFRTCVHELAHAILHGHTDHHSRPIMEVEAESVAFVVCNVLGLDSGAYSFGYVAHWAGSEDAEKMILKSGKAITEASNKIADALLSTSAEEDIAEAAE